MIMRSIKKRATISLATLASLTCGTVAALQLVSLSSVDAQMIDVPVLLVAISLIVLAHLVRVARLSLLWPDGTLETIFIGHSISIAAGSTIPFKLGEIARFLIIGHLNGSLRSGLKAIWAERISDAIFILFAILGALLAFVSLEELREQSSRILIVVTFLSLSALVFLALPSTLRWLRLVLLRSKENEVVLAVMRASVLLGTFIDRVPEILSARFGPIVILTTLIWSLEAITIAICLGLSRFDLLLTETSSFSPSVPEYLVTYILARTSASLLFFFAGTGLMLHRLKVAGERINV